MRKRCPECGEGFPARSGKQSYCSKFCHRRAADRARRVVRPSRTVKCAQCNRDYETRLSWTKYCSPACREARKTERRTQTMRRRREDPRLSAIDRMEAAQQVLARARADLFALDPEAVARLERRELEEGALDKAWEARERAAAENARNVTANRVADFLDGAGWRAQVSSWCVMRGLTTFDADAMWAAMRGDPRPIVIEPEPLPYQSSLMEDTHAVDWRDEEDE